MKNSPNPSPSSRSSLWLVFALIALGVSMRFLPHPANFAPITALAIFSGVYLKRWYAFFVPLAAMILSDAVIGFHPLIWATWGSFLLSGAIGLWVRRHRGVRRAVAGTLLASLAFFLITNWAVWAYTPLYEKTAGGLLLSYTMAIPFFRNTLFGDLFYVGMLFGLAESIAYVVQSRQRQPSLLSRDGYDQ